MQFNAANIGAQLNEQVERLKALLREEGSDQAQAIETQLEQDLKEHQDSSTIRLALIGQYSAGKSTIISALTGRRDIYIDADIATDQTTAYDWNGTQVIDTPGLFTDRQDHDQITYAAIEKSDLLVFCLTYSLFDDITVENFKKLAYDQGYSSKMMLVVNKMADEDTLDEAEQIQNYRDSLAVSLQPHALKDFQLCFIDAKDYCEGKDEDEAELIELSRFDSFITELNQFTSERGVLARLDTPIRIGLGATAKAFTLFPSEDRDSEEFLESLNRLANRVERERDRLRTQIKSFKLETRRALLQEADPLIEAVGIESSEEKWQALGKQAEINCEQKGQAAADELERIIHRAETSLREEVQKVMDSRLVQNFIARLQAKYDPNNAGFSTQDSKDFTKAAKFVNGLKDIAEGVGASAKGPRFAAQATSSASQTGSLFLKSGQVAGSNLHKAVYGAGKFIGIKFKPWAAVGFARGAGNFAAMAGPLCAVGGVLLQVKNEYDENKLDKQRTELRRQIRQNFTKTADDYDKQTDQLMNTFEREAYDKVKIDITQQRDATRQQRVEADDQLMTLTLIQTNLEALLRQLGC